MRDWSKPIEPIKPIGAKRGKLSFGEILTILEDGGSVIVSARDYSFGEIETMIDTAKENGGHVTVKNE